MQEDQSFGAAGDVPSFQPTWGPVMALVWAVAILVSAAIVVLVAGKLGFIVLVLPDGRVSDHAIMWIAAPLQIACIAIVASRLRANPLDVLALRFPRRVVRSAFIGFALLIVSLAVDQVISMLQNIMAWQSDNVPLDESQKLLVRAVARSGVLSSLALYGFIVPVEEEMMFRGLLLLSFFRTRLWFWGAAAITSVIFAVGHNPVSLDVLVHAPYFVMGLVFALALRLTGSLCVPIAMHALQNCLATLWSLLL